MASLFNTRISDTYVSIIKSIDNAVISSTLKQLSDGSGNGLGIYVNTSGDFKVSGILEFGSLKDTAESITITKFVDEADGIANNDNDTTIPTSAAVKDYVDTQITAEDLDFAGDTGSGSVDLDSQVLTISGTTNEIETSASGQTLTVGLPTNVTISGETSVGSLKTSGVYYFNGNTISHLSNSNLIFGFKSTTGFRVSFNAGTTDELLIENGSITGEVILDEDNMVSDSATKLATQQSIKAYVDSQVGANNELSEVLANGNTTGGTDISVSSGDDITFADSSQALFGAGSDLKIYHNGTNNNSFISHTGTGDLKITSAITRLRNGADTENLLVATENGSVDLYYDNSLKLSTAAGGVNIAGNLNMNSADGYEIRLGSDNDLKIYHNGTHSYIDDAGTGKLILRGNSAIELHKYTGEYMITAVADGAVSLYYDDSKKIETTSAGISVTGSATVSSDLILSDYGSGTHTGTATQRLGVDSSGNVIEIPIGAGAVDGSGTANTVTMWSDTDTITDAPITISGNNVNLSSGSSLYFGSTSVGITGNASGADYITFRTNANERARLDSSGRLGLGTSSPSSYNSNTNNFVIRDTGSGGMTISTGATSSGFYAFNNGEDAVIEGLIQYNHSDNSMRFRTNSVDDRLIISSSGDSTFGGTVTISGSTLTIADTGSSASYIYLLSSSTGESELRMGDTDTDAGSITYNNNSDFMSFRAGASERMRLDSSGQLAIGTTTATAPLTVAGDGDILSLNRGSFNVVTSLTSVNHNIISTGKAFNIKTSDSNNLTFSTNNTIALTLDTSQNATFAGDILFSSDATISRNTSDGSDNGYIALAGGGANSDGRGARMRLYGNEHASLAGAVDIATGNIAGSDMLLSATDTIQFNSGGTVSERMRITDGGDVGISNTSPSAKLHIGSGSSALISGSADELMVDNAGNSGITIGTGASSVGSLFFADSGSSASGYVQYNHSSNALIMGTEATERMRIDSSGDLTMKGGRIIVRESDDGNDAVKITRDADEGYVQLFSSGSQTVELRGNGDSYFNGGNVGINESNPLQKLHVNSGGGNSPAIFESTDLVSQIWLKDSSSSTTYQTGIACSGDNLIFNNGGEQARIDSSGNVGIGTSNPSYKLDIEQSAENKIRVLATGNTSSGLILQSKAGATVVGTSEIENTNVGNLLFKTGTTSASERARITSGGTLCFGTTDDDVTNNTTTSGTNIFSGGLIAAASASYCLDLNRANASDGEVARFRKQATQVGNISVTGTSTAYNTSSDYRLKEDLQDFNALEIASKIKMYDFKWKADDSRSYGVMAHELEEVLPQAVSGKKDAEEMQGVDYSKLVPILLKSIQELKAEIDELKNNV